MLQFLVSLNPSKHQTQRAILAAEMQWEREFGSRLGRLRLFAEGSSGEEQPQVHLFPEGPAPWVPTDASWQRPHHLPPASHMWGSIHFGRVCMGLDFAMIAGYIGHNFKIHKVLWNSFENKMLCDFNSFGDKTYRNWRETINTCIYSI